MAIVRMLALAVVTSLLVPTAPGKQEADIHVIVEGFGMAGPTVLPLAENLAQQILASAGIQISWNHGYRRTAESNAMVRISLESSTPEDYLPGVLAVAFPHASREKPVRVMYDRIQVIAGRSRTRTAQVLAHVLVHEITHILQGISRHSEWGIMKEHWDNRDYMQIFSGNLPFTAEDLRLIRAGIERLQIGGVRVNRFWRLPLLQKRPLRPQPYSRLAH